MKTPSYYNNTIIDSQLMQWHREGHSVDDIIAEARLTWPEVPEEYIRTTLQIIEKVNKEPTTESEDNPHECMVFLRYLHNQRMKELLRLEKRLDDEDCPMSVHTLYRGFMRDAESYCMKMFAMERDLFLAARKADDKIRLHRQKEAEQKNRLNETLKQAAQQQASGVEKPEAAPQPIQKQKNNQPAAVLGSLLGCCLSFWLSQVSKQQPAETYRSTHAATLSATGLSVASPFLASDLEAGRFIENRKATSPVIPSIMMLEGSGTETPISPGEPVSWPLNETKASLTPTWLSWLICPVRPAALSNVVPSNAAPKLTCVTTLPSESKINTPSPVELRPRPEPS